MYKQAKAYTTWRAWWKELRHQRDRLLAAAKKFRHGQLLASWNKWVYEAAEMRRSKFILNGALNRMLKRQLSRWQRKREKGGTSPQQPHQLFLVSATKQDL